MNRLLYRYLAMEILVPFLLGLAVFTGILFVGRLLNLANLMVSNNIPLVTMLSLLAHLLPAFCLITIPMAFLLAVLLAFGRLSGDSEIIAMKAAGISLPQLLPPVLTLATVCATLTLAIALYVLPNSTRSFKALLKEAVQNGASIAIHAGVFNDRIPGVVLYCSTYDDTTHMMRGILIQDERNPREPLTIFASSGTIQPASEGSAITVALTGGSIHGQKGTLDYRLVSFDRYTMNIPIALRDGPSHDEQDMTVDELTANLKAGTESSKRQRDMRLELHKRFAFPVACFIFALIGMSLGIQNQRSGKGAGFTLSVIVFVGYYVVLSVGKTLGQKGIVPPALAMWLPNVLFLCLGAALFYQTTKESQLAILNIRHLFTRRKSTPKAVDHAHH